MRVYLLSHSDRESPARTSRPSGDAPRGASARARARCTPSGGCVSRSGTALENLQGPGTSQKLRGAPQARPPGLQITRPNHTRSSIFNPGVQFSMILAVLSIGSRQRKRCAAQKRAARGHTGLGAAELALLLGCFVLAWLLASVARDEKAKASTEAKIGMSRRASVPGRRQKVFDTHITFVLARDQRTKIKRIRRCVCVCVCVCAALARVVCGKCVVKARGQGTEANEPPRSARSTR